MLTAKTRTPSRTFACAYRRLDIRRERGEERELRLADDNVVSLCRRNGARRDLKNLKRSCCHRLQPHIKLAIGDVMKRRVDAEAKASIDRLQLAPDKIPRSSFVNFDLFIAVLKTKQKNAKRLNCWLNFAFDTLEDKLLVQETILDTKSAHNKASAKRATNNRTAQMRSKAGLCHERATNRCRPLTYAQNAHAAPLTTH